MTKRLSIKHLDSLRRGHHWRYWLMALCTTAVLWLSSGVALAQAQGTYPAFEHPYVNDYGDVLSPEQETNVGSRLEQFRSETGVHAVLLTVDTFGRYETGDSTIESFATNLFNTWGIGDATRNDGILVLVAPGDRQMRIEVGAGYDSQADQTAQIIIDNQMLPYFRDGQMAAGTVSGVDAVIQYFAPGASQPAQPSSAATATQGSFWGRIIAFLLIPLSALGGLLRLVYGWWNRQRSRQCPTCQTEMRRLSEQDDDQYLEAGERREESLKSVDYDVWLCPTCGYHTTLSYNSLFSRYRKCSQCHHKTLSENSHTLVSPTYSSTGTAEITQDCKHCGHHHVFTRTIPRKQRSSSSSSSGGGGSSSGGGASGSW
ncbi:TPM domain-containing protein [Halomicronema sp. CCY15110]|uniref:TPM domain-containing protein n=1 Tax=Halomicronema sp. CCY15110 TaxID=2767773 RepID=UPI00194DE2AD|nr:TPM domain-containing protein [Halomicronema sp. CCY15110]